MKKEPRRFIFRCSWCEVQEQSFAVDNMRAHWVSESRWIGSKGWGYLNLESPRSTPAQRVYLGYRLYCRECVEEMAQ